MEILHFTDKQLSSALYIEDFFTKIGLFEKIREGAYKSIDQVWMNYAQNHELREALIRNAKVLAKKNHYTVPGAENAVRWDWLNFSPVSDYRIPRNEIWLLSPEEAESRRKELEKRK